MSRSLAAWKAGGVISCSCFRKSYVEGVISLLEWTVLEWSWMTGGVNFNAPR